MYRCFWKICRTNLAIKNDFTILLMKNTSVTVNQNMYRSFGKPLTRKL